MKEMQFSGEIQLINLLIRTDKHVLKVSTSKIKLISKRFDRSKTLSHIWSLLHFMDTFCDFSYYVSGGVVTHNIPACFVF